MVNNNAAKDWLLLPNKRLCFLPLAQAQVGPHAVNLAGGQAAGIRIAKDIMRQQQQLHGEASEKKTERSRTEEFVQHMRGLLWL